MKRQRIFYTFLFVLAFSFCSNKTTDYSINPIKQDQINENVDLGKATIMSEEEIINLDIESTSSNVELVYKDLEIQIKSECSVSCVSNTNNETLNNSLQVKQNENLNIVINGLEPNQEISVWIFSEPTYIGTYQSDDSGNLNLDLLVSESINQGTHTLQLINSEEDESINIPFVVITEEEVENPGDIKNCTDFNTYAEAKEWFDVYYFDTEVDEENMFSWKKGRSVNPRRTRCGGTDFEAPTEHAHKHSEKYDGYIILTDGYAPKPKPSKMRRVWIITPGRGIFLLVIRFKLKMANLLLKIFQAGGSILTSNGLKKRVTNILSTKNK